MRSFKILLFIGCISLFFPTAFLEAQLNQEALAKKALKTYESISKKRPNNKLAFLIMEAKTGRVLYEKNGYQKRYPASMTKMITLYLVFEKLKKKLLKFTDSLFVSKNAASKLPSKIDLKVGERISLKEAVMATITKSANDAATVLGETIGKTEQKFAILMTQKAKQLGMKKSQFRNASGWHDPGQYSSAYDMALLGRALLRDFPEYYPLFNTQSFSYKGRTYPNQNKLLGKIEGYDGVKTGFTGAAGFNLTASAKRGNARIIVVVMGARTSKERNDKVAFLIEKGFEILGNTLPASKEDKKEIIEVIELAQRNKKELSSDFDSLLTKLEKDFQTSATKNIPKKKVSSIIRDIPFKQSKELPPPPQNFPALANPKVPNWSVQVGTFASFQTAKKEAERLFKIYPNLLKKNLLKISLLTQKGLFPIRFTNLQKSQAELICNQLHQNKTPCIIISPRA